MIQFYCLECGMKFQVKDEFAGRATKCPTCKNPVQVPGPDKTLAFVPADSIEGTESSLDRAGVHPDITLASASDKGPASVENLAKKQVGRYVIDKEIARGGMGEVLRGIDRDIRREVAIKFMLNEHDARQKARFVEEAQITGQLEHPNIVPVHELGVDGQKRLFFTMKMVKGRSLAGPAGRNAHTSNPPLTKTIVTRRPSHGVRIGVVFAIVATRRPVFLA